MVLPKSVDVLSLFVERKEDEGESTGELEEGERRAKEMGERTALKKAFPLALKAAAVSILALSGEEGREEMGKGEGEKEREEGGDQLDVFLPSSLGPLSVV